MLITQSGSWQQGLRKKTIKSELTLGPVTLKFVTIALLATAALFYLAQSTQASSLKYRVMDLEEKKAAAQTDVNQLEVESARLQSLSEIEKSGSKMNMVPSN